MKIMDMDMDMVVRFSDHGSTVQGNKHIMPGTMRFPF